MNIKQVIELTGQIPNKFETDNKMFEVIRGTMADGSHSAMIWEMREGKQYHLHFITFGDTDMEAMDNMKTLILR